ncbi:DUF3426 domain-containing protein [Sesbania bispinosa]|nr:DUF3426 domain-containing protein [Sesbania bispinosa]
MGEGDQERSEKTKREYRKPETIGREDKVGDDGGLAAATMGGRAATVHNDEV